MIKNLIYDVGMYDGSDTLQYLQKGYHVVAIEADPNLIFNAKKKFVKYLNGGKLTIVNCGITEEEGYMDFFINETKPFLNSFDKEKASRENLPYHCIKIKCRTFDSILKEYGIPYYLKVDIEGYDRYCIDALSSSDLPQYVSSEASSNGDIGILESLYKVGYRKFQCINQNTFLPITAPYSIAYPKELMNRVDSFYYNIRYNNNFFIRVARKLYGQRLFEKLFKPSKLLRYTIGSSSGPFGDELEGEWLSFEKIKAMYLESHEMYLKDDKNSNYEFWCDFHASL